MIQRQARLSSEIASTLYSVPPLNGGRQYGAWTTALLVSSEGMSGEAALGRSRARHVEAFKSKKHLLSG